MLKLNPFYFADFYKTGHRVQYPEGTEYVTVNFTPRSSRLAKLMECEGDNLDGVINIGLQMFIQDFLINQFQQNFFDQPLDEVINDFKEEMDLALVTDYDMSAIIELHKLGYLPLEIKGLPEGVFVPSKVPVLTITNTHPSFFWLPNYIETVLSADMWKTMTTATIAFRYRLMLEKFATLTGSPMEFVDWQGHDFSARGLGNRHDMTMSSVGHLASFMGTDTIPAIKAARYYYGAEGFVGGSIFATEHSVMAAGGMENEVETFRRLIEDIYPTGAVSIVSDTWDLWDVIEVGGIADKLKDKILARKPNAIGLSKVVFRPDSGDPVRIICGYDIRKIDVHPSRYVITGDAYETNLENAAVEFKGKFYKLFREEGDFHDSIGYEEIRRAEAIGVVESLWEIFGGTTTTTGHKLLDSHVGVIYGDSITIERQYQILQGLMDKGFASANMVFGIGSYTYQYVTRDTYGFAMKATHAVIKGKDYDIFKDPVTDAGTKKSAKGRLRVIQDIQGNYVLLDQQTETQAAGGCLEVVYRDGKFTKKLYKFSEVRDNVRKEIKRRQ